VIVKRVLGIVFVVAAVAIGFAACKQGKGDRCQISADCQDGLLCSSATGTCVGSGAMNEIDAAVPDAPRFDAARDAPGDTPADSTGVD
jgi:hypothetical protein